jgi:phenylacetic acid degradation operon negative regulatory protein
MTQSRKVTRPASGAADTDPSPRLRRPATDGRERRPSTGAAHPALTARSVVASTLLGMRPPRLPAALLVRSGELFGIAEGTTRVALSRMVAAGELEPDEGGYRLAGPMLARQERQDQSRRPPSPRWNGSWRMAVVHPQRRSAVARADLRQAMHRLQLAEHRDGVWLRPDNLPADRAPDAQAVADAQCSWLTARPDDDPAALAATLWELDAWASEAETLRAELAEHLPAVDGGDTSALAPGFVLDAAVVRHLLADPRLPDSLVASSWPGAALRADFERYDRAYKAIWRTWFRAQR